VTRLADPQASRVWAITWVALYRLIRLVDPLIRSWMALGLPGFDGVVELRASGRRTGRPRRVLVTLLDRDGQWYVGHPNGVTSWQRNAEVAGSIEVEPAAAHGARFALRRLPRGKERDDVIAATGRQQFFPANVLYRASRRHIAAVGVYHRLVPIPGGAESPQAPSPAPTEGAR
jgi:hypothetical protein